jgi:hypothetical protein
MKPVVRDEKCWSSRSMNELSFTTCVHAQTTMLASALTGATDVLGPAPGNALMIADTFALLGRVATYAGFGTSPLAG